MNRFVDSPAGSCGSPKRDLRITPILQPCLGLTAPIRRWMACTDPAADHRSEEPTLRHSRLVNKWLEAARRPWRTWLADMEGAGPMGRETLTTDLLADAQKLGAVALAEFSLVLPGGEESLGDLAELLDVVAAVDRPGMDGDGELTVEGEGRLHELL